MRYIRGLSADMDDLTVPAGQKQAREFFAHLIWCAQQDFYENTTVVITGDHCSMDNGYFTRNVDENYTRHVYNCFLNAPVEPSRTENRQFSAMDMFPTTLAAMAQRIAFMKRMIS